MKRSARADGPGVCVPVGKPLVGILRPVAVMTDQIRQSDLKILTDARNRHVRSFLTEFVASEDRTRHWLIKSVGPNDSKILFMCEDSSGTIIGYMGLDCIDWRRGWGEADAVVRVVPDNSGFMTLSLRTLMKWAESQLGLKRLLVRVRSDNPAIHFYERAGFQEYQRVPLVKYVEPGLVRWAESEDAVESDTSLVHLHWRDES
jgi:RimJ/RimL family protein N-acetyltransferase